MAAIVTDTFTDTAGTLVTSHTSDSAHTWSEVALVNFGATPGDAQVQIGGVVTNANMGSDPQCLKVSDTTHSDLQISIDVAEGAFGLSAAIFFRQSDNDNYWYALLTATSLLIRKVVSGSETTVDSTTFSTITSATLTVTADGTSVSATDGTHTVSGTDSFNETETGYGFACYEEDYGEYDNFLSETLPGSFVPAWAVSCNKVIQS